MTLSKKAFDLLPPYPQPTKYHHHTSKSKKEKIKSSQTFLMFLFGLFFIFVIFSFINMGNFNTPNSTAPDTSKVTPTTDNSKQFELFDNEGQSGLTTTTNNLIRARIYNGSSSTNNINTAKDLLLKSGFLIEKSDQAANDYDQTMIYYPQGKSAQGQKAADALKPNFTAQLQESDNLDGAYDLLVIVGNK